MTAVIPEGLEPLAVWGEADPEWRDGIFSERFFWLTGHSPIVHVYRTRRIEFYLVDAPFAVVYRYSAGPKGDPHFDRRRTPLAEEPPEVVPLAELPPAHLLRG